MSAVRACAAALLRRRWAGVVALALLVGLGGGAVLAAAAGARRTSSAATRLYAKGRVADVEVDPSSQSSGRVSAEQLTRLRRIPEVLHATTVSFFPGATIRRGHPPNGLNVFVAANGDGTWIYDFDRVGLLPSFRGRMPDPSRADEVIATKSEARSLHVDVGSTLPASIAKFNPRTGTPKFGPPITLHVVGVATTPLGLLRGGNYSETFFFGTPAFAHRYADRSIGSAVYVQLHARDQLLAFEQAAPSALPGGGYSYQAANQELSTFARVARPFTSTLWIFALVAALATLLIVAQALIRMVRSDAREAPELAALGATRRQRMLVAGTRAGVAALVGAFVAIAVAVLASPLFPLGLVHRVEPIPGIRIDVPVLALGGLAIVALLGAVILAAAWTAGRVRLTGSAARTDRPSRVAAALARASAPVGIVQGARFAFQRSRSTGRGTTATSIVGLVAAVTAISAALVFGANLRTLTTPTRYGQTWDAEISGSGSGQLVPAQVKHTLTADSTASGITFGTFDSLRLDGQVVPAYGFQPASGYAMPVALIGRLARGRDEIALGAATLRQLHRTVGQTVDATTGNGSTRRLHIVGETLLPSLNPNNVALGADGGAALTTAGLVRLDPNLRNETDFVLVRFASQGSLHKLLEHYPSSAYTVTGAAAPGDIASYRDVRATPLILALLLTILGVGVLAHLLVTSVRTNRRELAVLKSMGCRRRQLRAMVIVQALLLSLVAAAIGLVIGIALGRGAWTRFVAGIGLPPATQIPTGALAALVAITLVSAALIAYLPARAATRVVAARVLHSE